MLADRRSMVISMAERNKWSMFFKAVEREGLIVERGEKGYMLSFQ